MEVSWNDERLKFLSLKNDSKKNFITNLTDIWVPRIEFIERIGKVQYYDVVTTSTKEQDGFLAGSDDLEKNYIYNGKTVRITKKSTIAGTFLCSFDNIYHYPFDKETCFIRMIVRGNDNAFTKLVASNFKYNGRETYLTLTYTVINIFGSQLMS